MDVQTLEDIGLTKVQAAVYKSLIEHGPSTAPQIAKYTEESRTNAYKILDKLCELGLATREDVAKKQHYTALSPAGLEQLVRQATTAAERRERKLQGELPKLLDFYFSHSEQPSIRYFQGKEGMRAIYADQVKEGQPLYFIRSLRDLDHFGTEELHKVRNLFPAHNIPRYAIIQDIAAPVAPDNGPRMPIAESDRLMQLTRTWITTEDYDEPVEWAVYGNKVSIMSFGEDVSGIIIQNAQIAQSFRRIYALLDEGIRRRPDYKNFPKYALDTRLPVSVTLKQKLKGSKHI